MLCGPDKPEFSMDHAELSIESNVIGNLAILTQASECYKCPLVPICSFINSGRKTVFLAVNTTFTTEVAVELDNSTICRFTKHFGEYGKYQLLIQNSSNSSLRCQVEETVAAVNSNLPVLYAFIFYLLLTLVLSVGKFILCKVRGSVSSSREMLAPEDPPGNSPAPKKQRLKSLDTFRGISIVVMIFVNYGGGGYWFFAHSSWNGLTVADLVFPWFMFIMGTSMAFAFEGQLKRGVSRQLIFLNIFRRSLILFGLGVFLNSEGNTNVFQLRILGVLQKFGIAYLVVGGVRCVSVKPSAEVIDRLQETSVLSRLLCIRDLIAYWIDWLIMLLLLTVYLIVTLLLPVPGCPTGYLGPGGLSENLKFSNCTGGAAAYIDRLVFTTAHMYQWPTCRELYNTNVPYDPEGLWGNIGSIFLVFLGLQAGQILLFHQSHRSRLLRWILWGVLTGLIGGILCNFTQNEGWIPVNKNLWSVSYVMAMASMAFLLLSALYIVIDINQWWDGGAMRKAGMNSIVLYMGHELFHSFIPISFEPISNTHMAHLAMDLWGTSFWVLVAVYLDHKKNYHSI